MRDSYSEISLVLLIMDLQRRAATYGAASSVWARFEAEEQLGNALLTSFALGGYPAAWQFVLAIAKED